MGKVDKTSNIILRVSNEDKSSLELKANLFNLDNSKLLRKSAFSYWENPQDTKHFKKLLKMYTTGDPVIKNKVVTLLFNYYREIGFPYTKLTDEEKNKRMTRIMNSKDILLEDNILQMNIQGMDLANSYHPHMMDAYYITGEKSPMETFLDDDKLKDCINRWLELGKTPNHSGMRRILKTHDGTKGVVNFKPTIAKFLYDKYVPEGGKILDPCAGYGGRLCGCIASNRGLFYHGIDPNEKAAIGNMKLAGHFYSQENKNNDVFVYTNKVYNFNFRFDLGCAEEVMPNLNEKYSVIFTSPPYVNTEIYSESCDQSCHKYKIYEDWLEKFLWVIVNESKRLLVEGGKLILNIKNTNKYKIADDLVEYCKKDWELEEVYHMKLSNSEYRRKEGNTFHTEPIFVFGKK